MEIPTRLPITTIGETWPEKSCSLHPCRRYYESEIKTVRKNQNRKNRQRLTQQIVVKRQPIAQ
jgi:hypothetical protein